MNNFHKIWINDKLFYYIGPDKNGNIRKQVYDPKTGIRTIKKYDYKAGIIYVTEEKDGKSTRKLYDLNGNMLNQNKKTANMHYSEEILNNVEYFTNRITNMRFNINQLTDIETIILADLFKITPEQVRNLDKSTYRKLSIKLHPDRNPDDDTAVKLFEILNRLYHK